MTIEIADRLCAYRKQHGFSQEELAEKLGVSRQAVSKWERAEASPDTDNLIALADVYGITLDALLHEDPQTQAKPLQNDVSFKNGIHIRSKSGDLVDIDFTGVHVHANNGDHVDIDKDGVNVGKGDENAFENGHIFSAPKKHWLLLLPYPVLCVIAFLLWGFLGGSWGYNWLVFLTIPLYYTGIEAIIKKDASHFAYPVLVTLVYLICGLFLYCWHPTWILFVTIPIYYFICETFLKNKHKEKEE